MDRLSIVPTLAVIWLVAAGTLIAPSMAVEHAACAFDFELETHERYTASGDDAVVLEFEVSQSVSGWFYYGLAFRAEESGAPIQEGALAGRILETDDGEIVSAAATRVFRYGAHVTVGDVQVEATSTLAGFCGYIASGGFLTLEPGSYRFVVPGISDHGSERGALIPASITDVDVSIVPGRDLTPRMPDCAANTDVGALVAAANVLVDCEVPLDVAAGARAYWIIYSDRSAGEDPLREAHWEQPGGASERVSGFLVGSGASGEHRLRVPHWVAATMPPFPFLPPGTFPDDPDLVGVGVGY